MSDDSNVLFCPQLRDIQVTVKEENTIREKKLKKNHIYEAGIILKKRNIESITFYILGYKMLRNNFSWSVAETVKCLSPVNNIYFSLDSNFKNDVSTS